MRENTGVGSAARAGPRATAEHSGLAQIVEDLLSRCTTAQLPYKLGKRSTTGIYTALRVISFVGIGIDVWQDADVRRFVVLLNPT